MLQDRPEGYQHEGDGATALKHVSECLIESKNWAIEAPRAHPNEAKRPVCRARHLRAREKRRGRTKMRILVVGSGGREHALCWTIAASPLCEELYCAPGNAGIAQDAVCVPIGAEDVDGLFFILRRSFTAKTAEKPAIKPPSLGEW